MYYGIPLIWYTLFIEMNIISLKWRPDLAYVVGLIATDGSLSKDKRHIDFTSKDYEQIVNFKKILCINSKYRLKNSGSVKERRYYSVQFSHVKLYRFLESTGLYSNKSKTLGEINVPDKYFGDLLRGLFDGDGYTTSHFDKRWKSSFVLYSGFTSASKHYLHWLLNKIKKLYGIEGRIKTDGKSAQTLYYAKYASVKLFKQIYYRDDLICLKRKKFKFEQSLCIIEKLNKRKC